MLGRIRVKVKAMSGILQHNPQELLIPSEGNGSKGQSKVDRNSREWIDKQFENAQYRTKSGRLFQPSDHFQRAFEIAGTKFKFKGKETYSNLIKGGITIEPEEILFDAKVKPKIYTKLGRIPPGPKGARVPIHRALIDDWTIEFDIVVFNDSINFEDLKGIVQYAGSYIGIGDWRPRFGRFEVVKFEKVSEK